MSVLQSGITKSLAEAYTIDNSLRFNDGDSPGLGRTPGSEGNRRTWTVSFWFKYASTVRSEFFSNGSDGTHEFILGLEATSGALSVKEDDGSQVYKMSTSAKHRDPSAWYHAVVAMDTTESTDTDRIKMWINGDKVTAFNEIQWPAENLQTSVNTTVLHTIGYQDWSDDHHFDGYLAEYYFIDGTAYDADDFGELSSTTNQWIPKDAVDDLTFGTNGFYQKYGGAYPYGSKTVLLLHCDGSNGGTTFTDATGNQTVTSTACTTTTSDKKFGTASADFDGGATERYLVVTHTSNMDFDGEFTIDFWTKVAAAAPTLNNRFYQKGANSATGWGLFMSSTNIYFGREDEDLGCGFARSLVVGTGDWHHIAVTRGSDNYFRIFLDGVLKDTSDSAYSDNLNDSANTYIGANAGDADSAVRFNGLIDEFRIVKGLALWTDTFTPATEAYSSLGLDSSGNGNDFSVTNLVAIDQMIDTPTNNFCTLNPLQTTDVSGVLTFSEGNLALTSTGYYHGSVSTFAVNSGKWYWEFCSGVYTISEQYNQPGFTNVSDFITTTTTPYAQGKYLIKENNVAYLSGNGTVSVSGGSNSGLPTTGSGDIVMIALDLENGRAYFGVNGTWVNSGNPETATNYFYGDWYDSTQYYTPQLVGGDNSYGILGTMNFGQDSSFAGVKTAQGNQDSNEKGDFYYAPPTDYLALCTDNLPAPEIALPGDNFNTVLYDGTTTIQTINTVVQNDLTWLKMRSDPGKHYLWDSVRTFGNTGLNSDNTAVEGNDSTYYTISKNATGFDITQDGGGNEVNYLGETYVAWNWKAGGAPTADNSAGAGATPTAGSVKIDGANLGSALAGTLAATKLSANTTAGFSIVEYTSTGGGSPGTQTVAHGLSLAPEMIIVKSTDSTYDWTVYSSASSLGNTRRLVLNSDAARGTAGDWEDTTPSASVFTIGNGTSRTNDGSSTYICYCFQPIEGYSKIGVWTGNASADGPFIYTGFRPAYLLLKRTDGVTSWLIEDDKRLGYNIDNNDLLPNQDSAEQTDDRLDIVSNGFKLRSAFTSTNASGGTYLYMAFAKSPFKYSNAR